MTDSQQLLAEYRQNGSDAAFRELVTRYLDLVYSTALRLVEGDTHRAEDVTQTVFVDLARKARTLPHEVRLGGWLHRDTCLVAGHTMRGERRRQSRERQAVEMNVLQNHSGADFSQVAPLLDEAINELGEAERTAILLRFFEQQDFRAVGQALGSSEDAARMRVTRALDKLHKLLSHRGVTLSAAALGTALATEAVTAAPAGLAGSVAATVLAGAAAGGGITATLVKLTTMTRVKMVVVSAFAVAGLTTFVAIQHQAQDALRAQDKSLRQQSEELARQQAENERLAGLVQAGGSRANTLDELASIRNEVEALRKQTNSLGLRARNALQPNGAPSTLEMREEEKRSGIALLNYTKQWLSAFLKFASQNRDRFPTSFDQARPFLSARAISTTNFTSGQFEILDQGSTSNISAPARVVLLREKQARRSYDGSWSRAYGFADGHSEMMTTEDGNFDAWEKRQLVWPPPDR